MNQEQKNPEIEESQPTESFPKKETRSGDIRSRWNWLKPVLLGILILCCGMAIGSSVTMHVMWKRMISSVQRPEDVHLRVVQRMKHHLNLAIEQEEKLREILQKHEETIRSIREEYQPKIHEEMQNISDEVEAILTPEQAEQWSKRFGGMERMWLGPPPGGGRGFGRRFRGGEGPPFRRGPRGPGREAPPPPPDQ